MSAEISDPVAVVQRQLDAYNARDLEGFVSCYAADAQLFEHPDKLLAQGTAQLRERYAVRFQEANLHAVLVGRVAMGRMVIDHEKITRTFPEGPGTSEAVVIYEIADGRIARAWLISGAKTLDPQS